MLLPRCAALAEAKPLNSRKSTSSPEDDVITFPFCRVTEFASRTIGIALFAKRHWIFRDYCTTYRLTTSSRGADQSISSRGEVVSLHRGGMAQSIITQVTKETEYTPCPATEADNSINTATANGDVDVNTTVKTPKLSSAWCVCRWLISCMKKDEPAVGATTFQNDHSHNTSLSSHKYLLHPRQPSDEKKCIVIDLDETLVHSSFKPVSNADFIVPVEIEGVIHQVYVLKRPHCDEFLKRMGEMFECVLFTASLAKYADPVADLLDPNKTFSARLFRESCVFHRGNYVKDLSRLGRDIRKVVIIDNSPQSYIFHPDNAVPVTSWFDDPNDTELLDLIPFFEALDKVDNVLTVLGRSQFQNPSPTSSQNGSFHEPQNGTLHDPQNEEL